MTGGEGDETTHTYVQYIDKTELTTNDIIFPSIQTVFKCLLAYFDENANLESS